MQSFGRVLLVLLSSILLLAPCGSLHSGNFGLLDIQAESIEDGSRGFHLVKNIAIKVPKLQLEKNSIFYISVVQRLSNDAYFDPFQIKRLFSGDSSFFECRHSSDATGECPQIEFSMFNLYPKMPSSSYLENPSALSHEVLGLFTFKSRQAETYLILLTPHCTTLMHFNCLLFQST